MSDGKNKNVAYQLSDKNYKPKKNATDEENDCWASDSCSSSGSYYSNSASSAPIEWESEISPLGEVFYIESLTENLSNIKSSIMNRHLPSPELNRRRSTRAKKLVRLIKRRESYRHSIRLSGLASEFKRNHDSISKISKEKEYELKNGEKYTVNIWVDPEKRHKLGRRATACEAYLGINLEAASGCSKVIVAGFVPDGEALKSKQIKVGDCLQSINSDEVNNLNIENILADIDTPKNILCHFQSSSQGKIYENVPTALSCPNQSALARQLVDKEESKILMDSLVQESLGVIFVKMTEFSESESELQGVFYCFPKSNSNSNVKDKHSFLITIKGALVTLNHMLPDIIGLRPLSTMAKTPTGLVHIVYFTFEEELLLICLPEKCCNKNEAIKLSEDLMTLLSFTHENLKKCFASEENHGYLDHLFYLFFSSLYKDRKTNYSRADSLNLNSNIEEIKQCDFNFLLSDVQSVKLPRDAQIQIDAALSEMEAMDYRDWNQDPLECQRLYTIIGSCLYHRKYLLATHLPSDDLKQVHSFLKRHGIINLINKEQVKSLVIWKRVFPSTCINRVVSWEDDDDHSLADNKWFLLIIGLAENSGPDIFYVEEAQETLKHIRKIGVSTLAEKWINSNAKPEITVLQKNISRESINVTDSLVDYIKTSQLRSSNNVVSTKTSYEGSHTPKNRSVEEGRSEINSEISRDSPSQDSISQVSSLSDQAPVLGRRATREKANLLASKISDDSDTDLDTDRSMLNEISNIRENLLNQAEYIVPKVITTGDKNSLLYFVHIDLFEGILISSKLSQLDRVFLSNLNVCSQMIHKLLSDTKRYKKLLTQDAGKSVINKSLIAIKEHGVLFEYKDYTYWVVGRLFTTPRPKELYICYQDCAPQNLIEMAFRLQSTNC